VGSSEFPAARCLIAFETGGRRSASPHPTSSAHAGSDQRSLGRVRSGSVAALIG
jgi:hypothetical protein